MQTDEMKYVLYLAVNQVNGKKYVGFTGRKLAVRKAQHEHDTIRRNSQLYFHCAIRKYGVESFKWYVIGWSADAEDIKAQEIANIKFYKGVGEELYNTTDGGDGLTNPSPEVRAKLAANGRRLAESGHCARIAAMGGRANVESGHLARMRELPQTKVAQRANGRAVGRKAVESGHIQALGIKQGRANVESGHLRKVCTREVQIKGGRVGGRISGRKHKENKTGIFAPGIAAMGGRVGGRKTVANGTGIHGLTPNERLAACSKGGRAGVESGHVARMRELPQTKAAQHACGRGAVESGQLASICAMGGRVGGHTRWHVSRNIVKLDCKLCNPNAVQISETQAVAA
jgi:hypothetical protein